MRPPCSVIAGSTPSARSVVSLACVASSFLCISREYPATSAATIAANLRPTLPGCASAMTRGPTRGSIMYDGTPSRHRADLTFGGFKTPAASGGSHLVLRAGISLDGLSGSTGQRLHREEAMIVEEQRDPRAVISLRTLVQGLGVGAGATVAAMSGALAQGSNEATPPTTITSPPRDFSPRGAPTTYFWDP